MGARFDIAAATTPGTAAARSSASRASPGSISGDGAEGSTSKSSAIKPVAGKADVERRQRVDAAREQRRAGEQRDRDGHLRRHEDAPGARERGAAGGAAGAVAKGLGDVEPGNPERGAEREQQSRDDAGADGDPDERCVERKVEAQRERWQQRHFTSCRLTQAYTPSAATPPPAPSRAPSNRCRRKMAARPDPIAS